MTLPFPASSSQVAEAAIARANPASANAGFWSLPATGREPYLAAGVLLFSVVSHLISRCYTSRMPTTRPRYTLTDTGVLREQLDEAQRRWPEVRSRKELLLRLAEVGRTAIAREADERKRTIARTAGMFT